MKKIEKQKATDETHALMEDLVHEDEAVYACARELFGTA
jgi:hypothetical protein